MKSTFPVWVEGCHLLGKMGNKLNCIVEVMPSFLFRLVESITLILNRGPQIMLVRVDQVRRWERVCRTALNIMVYRWLWHQCWCRVHVRQDRVVSSIGWGC